ncbi:glycosyltransferase [Calothrix sp. PCC 6303]|uniref:glycosyltransferase n=1 Tax=Calothrix sp. PCC 6303 TaxID=1170562 RepID=UPI0002A01810|nr:glycosyltransferase [Calothrix sp. PCC 6303]AFZ02051.1 glycosyl transferase group 1 [Calothrix sp. PCC 6303]
MKVLHVIPSVTKLRGGTSQAVLDMVRALQMINVDAEIATTNDDGDNLLDVPLGKRIQYNHVPVWFFERFSPNIKPIREYAFTSELTQWLWENISRYDLVHVHALFSYPSTIAMAIARLKNVPYIVTPHGLLCEWSLGQSTRKKQIYSKIIEKSNLNHSQGIHFTSQKEQQEVSKLGLNVPGFVIPLGLSIPDPIPDAYSRLRQLYHISASEPVILFLSRLHHKKGLDYLIPALSKVSHHKFTFILAGSGTSDYEAEIESLLVSNGLRDRTILTGFVAGEDKDLLMQAADLFTLTSHSENFAVSVLEALAVGVPVLVTPGVALAAVVQANQVGYIPDLNVSAIADALESYFRNPQQAKQMGEIAHKFVLEKYTWKRIASQLQEVYTSILDKSLLLSKRMFIK